MDFVLLNLPAVIAGVVLIALLVAVLLYAARLSEPAPVTTEPAGPATGSLSMERKVSAIVAMILGLVVLFFGYGLRESSRQDEARIQQRNQSIDRGINTYTTLC